MTKLASSLVLLLFIAPSVSLAAPLTQAQSESLIGIVQASPNIPASAFTGLITAFSHITTDQAASLIGVIKASPSGAKAPFVALLTAFTQDSPHLGLQATAEPAPIVITPRKCSTGIPTPEDLMITDEAPPVIDFSVLTNPWKKSWAFGTTTNSLGFALTRWTSIWSGGLVTDVQNCSRMDLITEPGSVAYIEYFLDGSSLGKPFNSGNANYAMPLYIANYSNGLHTLSITAMDAGGHSSSSSTQIYIDNP